MSSSRSTRNQPGWGKPLRLLLRLMLMGVGLGVITGSGLKLLAPQVQKGQLSLPPWLTLPGSGSEPKIPSPTRALLKAVGQPWGNNLGRFEPKQEVAALSERWRQLAAQQKDLKVSAFLLVLDDGRFAELDADVARPAASAIKTPILLAGLERLDAGDLRWNEPLTMTKPLVGGGAGWMANKPVGTRFPAYEVATEMIHLSDNTATNLLIDRAGGQQAVNARFTALGLTATRINNWLPDLKGTNTTSARDLARSIALVETGEVLSTRSRDLFREVMSTSRTNRLLPGGLLKGLGGEQGEPDKSLLQKGYRVYNKTGDIGIAYADAALIELPDGSRAVAAFLVQGPFNDPRSTDLIIDMAAAMAPILKPKAAPPRAN